MKFPVLLSLSCATLATTRSVPFARRQSFLKQNGEDAIALNQQFANLTTDSSCNDGDIACIQGSFAQCDHGAFVVQPCSTGTVCTALPLALSPGTTVTCTTPADRDARIAATGATPLSSGSSASSGATGSATSSAAPAASPSAAANNTTPTSGGAAGNSTASGNSTSTDGSGPQTSLTLSPQVIVNFTNDGQDLPTAGQVPSLTSSNNFINFCLTVPHLPLTNGQQLANGSCNPAPMGVIAASANMPSAKFVSPANGAVLPANATFTVRLAVAHLATGLFANADENYLAAPQQVDPASGDVQGHAHVVVEKLDSMQQTRPTDPAKFVFFKGLNDKAQNGVLTADVTGGLAAGVYRIASISTAANHQPVLVAVAQHGAMDDMVYFTVREGAGNATTSAVSDAGSATGAVFTSAASATLNAASATSVGSAATDATSAASVASAIIAASATSVVSGISSSISATGPAFATA